MNERSVTSLVRLRALRSRREGGVVGSRFCRRREVSKEQRQLGEVEQDSLYGGVRVTSDGRCRKGSVALRHSSP